MCISACVCECTRVNEVGRANISCQREKRRVKSDEKKTGRKQGERGGGGVRNRDQYSVREKRGTGVMERG